MTKEETAAALRERLKELTFLYDISGIAAEHDSLSPTLQAIADRMTAAWQYSKDVVISIEVDDAVFSSGKIPKTNAVLKENLPSKIVSGSIRVYYPSPAMSVGDFLPEEGQFLRKVAHDVATIADRFHREKREETLRRTIERNDRLGILGEITAGVAHELNTPLGNILGFSEFIAQNAENPQQQKDAEKIRVSAMYAREVVKKLMFFSCEMPQRMESIAINPLVEDAIKLLTPTLNKEGVKIEFTPDPKNPFGQVDPIQITQVIFNMLINATHASDQGGTISIFLQSADKFVNIIIEDYGHGIPTEIQEKIFEPFFTTKDIGEGSGLGLSVVHGIVKSHRGNIRFSTELKVGTTFNISLPLRP